MRSKKRQSGLVVLHLDIAVLFGLVGLAGDDVLAVAVELEASDDHVGGVDVKRDGGAVGLFSVHALDVNDPFLAVDLENLAFGSLGGSTNNQDLVILADGNRTNLKCNEKVSISLRLN